MMTLLRYNQETGRYDDISIGTQSRRMMMDKNVDEDARLYGLRKPLLEQYFTEDPRQPTPPTDETEDWIEAPVGQDPDLRMILLIATILNSALYLVGVFVAGLVLGNRTAWLLSLLTMALCYFAASAQVTWPPAKAIAIAFVCASIAVGAMAGMALVFLR